jgi:hypothetical protein
MAFRHMRHKLKKNDSLLKCEDLRKHVLETVSYTYYDLQRMIDSYGAVYIKPNNRGKGLNVRRVATGDDLKKADEFVIKNHKKNSFFIIQQAVDPLKTHYGVEVSFQGMEQLLAARDGNVFVIRTTLMKPHDEWKMIHLFSTLAPNGSYITNTDRGGKRCRFGDVMRGTGISREDIYEVKFDSCIVSLMVCDVLEFFYPGIAVIGCDIGIDKDLNLWIIEANTRPGLAYLTDFLSSHELKLVREYCKALKNMDIEEGTPIDFWPCDREALLG